jgi:hypothetical protein
MKTIRRIVAAILASLIFNILLMAASPGSQAANSSLFWRFVDLVSKPATLVVEAIVPRGPSIEEMAFASMIVSVGYFAIVIWLGLTLFSSLRTLNRRRYSLGKDGTKT